MSKIMIVKYASSCIIMKLNSLNSVFKFRIAASRGRIKKKVKKSKSISIYIKILKSRT